MQSPPRSALMTTNTQPDIDNLYQSSQLEIKDLKDRLLISKSQVANLQAQLDWFKQQIFGQKSEKRIFEQNPNQGSLLAGLTLPEHQTQKEPETQKVSYTQRFSLKAQKSSNSVVNLFLI